MSLFFSAVVRCHSFWQAGLDSVAVINGVCCPWCIYLCLFQMAAKELSPGSSTYCPEQHAARFSSLQASIYNSNCFSFYLWHLCRSVIHEASTGGCKNLFLEIMHVSNTNKQFCQKKKNASLKTRADGLTAKKMYVNKFTFPDVRIFCCVLVSTEVSRTLKMFLIELEVARKRKVACL